MIQMTTDSLGMTWDGLEIIAEGKPANNFGFNFGMNVIRADQFGLVLIEPIEKSAPRFGRQFQNGFFDLFDAHDANLQFGFSLANKNVARTRLNIGIRHRYATFAP